MHGSIFKKKIIAVLVIYKNWHQKVLWMVKFLQSPEIVDWKILTVRQMLMAGRRKKIMGRKAKDIMAEVGVGVGGQQHGWYQQEVSVVTQSDHFLLLTSQTPWNLYLQAAVVSFWQQTAAWLTSTDYKTAHSRQCHHWPVSQTPWKFYLQLTIT